MNSFSWPEKILLANFIMCLYFRRWKHLECGSINLWEVFALETGGEFEFWNFGEGKQREFLTNSKLLCRGRVSTIFCCHKLKPINQDNWFNFLFFSTLAKVFLSHISWNMIRIVFFCMINDCPSTPKHVAVLQVGWNRSQFRKHMQHSLLLYYLQLIS
jgi:hypothetical protein